MPETVTDQDDSIVTVLEMSGGLNFTKTQSFRGLVCRMSDIQVAPSRKASHEFFGFVDQGVDSKPQNGGPNGGMQIEFEVDSTR